MMPHEERELQKLLKALSLADLTRAKRLLAKELDERQGRHKPVEWPPNLQTR
jgi:hypothetical protein